MYTVYDRLGQNFIPCLGQTGTKLYTLFRKDSPEIIHPA